MKSIFLACSFLWIMLASGQAIPDVSGEWNGTSSFQKKTFKIDLHVKQKGNQLTALYYQKTLRGRDSLKATFSGHIKDGFVRLVPVNVEYATGLQCVGNLTLELKADAKLVGFWKGDWKLTTCAPGVAGPMTFFRKKTSTAVQQVRDAAAAPTEYGETGDVLIGVLQKRTYHALIIGINDYTDESITDLDMPVQDAEALKATLAEMYTFDEENITVLLNPKREEIISTLDQLTQVVKDTDNLLVFYAGHGIWSEKLNQGYWLPADASKDNKSFWLSNSTIRDYLRGIPAKHTLLISDACFSGGILKERAVFEDGKAMLELYKLKSRKAMTSGTLTTVPDESVFMKYLVSNLRSNAHPMITADQLFRNFKIAVINNSPNGQVPQYGPIVQTGDEGGDFIFLRRMD